MKSPYKYNIMTKKIAINGSGRIGRASLRANLTRNLFEIVAINDLSDIHQTAHLIKYDTMYGTLPNKVEVEGEYIVIDGHKILHTPERDPANLPWKKLGVDIVLECTGIFTTPEKASLHLQAGAKKVLLSAPGKGVERTIVRGVNDSQLKDSDVIVSNASCTTNCTAPIVMLLDKHFGIESGFLSTVHSYTNSQNIVDSSHKDIRRGRAAALNIIPTTTGATKAVVEVLPNLKGKLTGQAYRVPTATGSIIELNLVLKKETSREVINNIFEKASKNELAGILAYTQEQLVSSDYVGNPHSCIIDSEFTEVLNGNMVRVLAWYDNEWGYSNRLIEIANEM